MATDANVKALQQALTKYAQGTGFTAANPGAVDGIVGLKTVTAVMAMVPLLPAVPSEIRQLAMLGPIVLSSPAALESAKSFVKKNANTLYKSVIGLAAYQVATGNVPKPVIQPVQVQANPIYQPMTPVAQPKQWFKTWWGAAAIGGTLLTVAAVGVSLARR